MNFTNSKLLFIVTILSGIIMNTEAKGKTSFPSKIEEATVFYHGAELKHSADVTLQDGQTEIWIEGLSSNIDKNSLKIGTNNGLVISAYEYVADRKPESISDPVLKAKQDSLNTYIEKKLKLGMVNKIDSQTLELLQKSMLQKLSSTEKTVSIDELSKYIDYFKTKSIDVEMTMHKNEIEIKQLNEDIERIKKELDGKIQRTGALKLTVVAAKNTTTSRITVGYCTQSAGWTPFYNINAESPDKPVTIISKANVHQNTGADWKNVKLVLSTGTLNNGRTAPELHTWFLKNYNNVTMRSYGSRKAAAIPVAMAEATAYKEESVMQDNTMDDYLVIDDNALVTTYTIDLPYDIPGNGKEQNIDLRTQKADAEYHFYCAPKIDTECYLIAEIKDDANLDLPSGKAQITYEGMYLGETYIDAATRLDNLKLTFGTDKRISVKREKMKDFSSRKVFGSDIEQVFTYKVTVKNNRPHEAKLMIKEQYPVSTQKNVKVELLEETTKSADNDTEKGIITWQDTFKSGETKSYTISYSVKYPKDMRLNL